jgi:hypothetical protein
VREKFPATHIFFGLGYSELLLITGGKDMIALLDVVTGLRNLRSPGDSNRSLFAKTTTFPLISCAQVHNPKAYDKLEGKKFQPIITATCEPVVEQSIAAELRKQGMYVRNIFGKSDLIIGWNSPIGIAEVANFLTQFRSKWGPTGTLVKTSTYLQSPIEAEHIDISAPSSTVSGNLSIAVSSPLRGVMTEKEEALFFDKLRKVKPFALQIALSDLTLRLSACLNAPQIGEHYLDMVNTLPYLSQLVEKLHTVSPTDGAHYTAESVVDLVRSAINQRYAGLEFHPETLAHSHVPLLCDIRTVVAAATCVPHFIFDHLFSDKRAFEVWPGFVIFGGTNAPQYLHQDILALPPMSLFQPIEEWWKITHEAAHGIFRMLNVYTKLPVKTKDYVETPLQKFGLDDYFFIDELFANWFDWKYIFNKDTAFYLKCIWESWTRVPRVHKSKSQYLARSFVLSFSDRLPELFSLMQVRRKEGGQPWLDARWEEFITVLHTIPAMAHYLEQITPTEKKDTIDLAFYASPILAFFENDFEKACNVKGLSERLNPPYPQVDEHIRLLNEGRIIRDPIPNPSHLHLKVLKSLKDNPSTLATEIAFLFSLENTYLQVRG